MVSKWSRDPGGFSLLELVLTVAFLATLSAIAVPIFTDLAESQRLTTATRDVERELQAARLKAVSANRRLRLRTNCPVAGQFRLVEVLGTAADDAGDRCSPAAYPYPAADTDMMTRPNYDGPVRYLSVNTTVTTAAIEFRPDGTAREVVGGVPQAIADFVTVTITRYGQSRTVGVNALGKIEIQ